MSRAADGGVLLSARDIAPWAVVLADDGLLAGGARNQLFVPAMLTTGRAAPYGCGVFMEECRRSAFHHHSGGVPGFVSQRMAFGGSGIQVSAVTNTDGDTNLPLGKLCLAMAEGLAPNSTSQPCRCCRRRPHRHPAPRLRPWRTPLPPAFWRPNWSPRAERPRPVGASSRSISSLPWNAGRASAAATSSAIAGSAMRRGRSRRRRLDTRRPVFWIG